MARAGAVRGQGSEASAAEAIAGIEQILAVARPGEAADALIVEGEAAYASAGGVAEVNIGAVVLRMADEGDAAAGGGDRGGGIALGAFGRVGDALHLARIERDQGESGGVFLAALH